MPAYSAWPYREAIRRDPSFHRAVYNLGTIMYALSEQAGRRREVTPGGAVASSSPDELKTAAAVYICCAQAAGRGLHPPTFQLNLSRFGH
jgi:hypothetical protein